MSKIKVALIEDDAAIVQMYSMHFGLSKSLEVKVANDGLAGLALIKDFNPDIILLDMMMPTMSGIECLTKLRELPNGDQYKVIALTNMQDNDTKKKLANLKVLDYMVKAEHTPGEIEARIHSLLKK